METIRIIALIALWVAACALMDLFFKTESRAWVMCYGFGVGSLLLLLLGLPPYENNHKR